MTLAPSAYDTTPERLHAIEGTYNLRDVGGYRAESGRTRWGKLYRSDALHRLTEASRDRLAELGLRVIVDLRDESELLAAPSRIEGLGIRVIHEPVFTGDPNNRIGSGVTLESLYRSIVAEFGENIAAAIGHIAATNDEPVLVHCTAGKDRTGLVIAFTLLAVGVDHDEVVADYAATEGNLSGEWAERMTEQMAQTGAVITPDLAAIIAASPAAVLRGVIELIERNYGSIASYLIDNGLDERELADLRAALIEPAPNDLPTTNQEGPLK